MPVNWWMASLRARSVARQVADSAAVTAGRRNLPIIYVPGILGVKLHDRCSGVDIWGAPGPILFPKPHHKSYAVDETGDVVASGTLHHFSIVPGLVDTLVTADVALTLKHSFGYQEGRDLVFLDHDWRRDYRLVAQRIEHEIRRIQMDYGRRQRVLLIGQSMANLAIRLMVRHCSPAIRDSIAKWYAFGPPWQGTYNALKMLREGYYPAGRRFRGFTPAEVATYAPCYQLLPVHARLLAPDGRPVAGFDLLQADCWREHGVGDAALTAGDRACMARLQARLDDAKVFASQVAGTDPQEQKVPQVWFAGDRNHAVTAAAADPAGALVTEQAIRTRHPGLVERTLAVGDDHIPLAHLTGTACGPIVRSRDAVPHGESYVLVGQAKDHRALINHPPNLHALAMDIAAVRSQE